MKNKNNLINVNNINPKTALKHAESYNNITSRVNMKLNYDLNMHLENLINFYGLEAVTILVNQRNKKSGAA